MNPGPPPVDFLRLLIIALGSALLLILAGCQTAPIGAFCYVPANHQGSCVIEVAK